MKAGTISAIAATLTAEFTHAVQAAEKADAEHLAALEQSIEHAMTCYDEAQVEIDEKRTTAARLVAESLEMERVAKEQLQEAMRTARRGFTNAGAEKLAGVKGLRLIAGKKTA